MSTIDINSEDADMSECDGEKVVTMMDVLQEQEEFEEDANAVLGASDDKNCTYSKGYIKRQAIYACLTCCVEARNEPTKRAGVCLACSLNCHENHELIELYTKRNFRCDCGNPKFNSHPCQFTPNKTGLNEDNSYNQNFSGLYCTCHRPYPDPESPIEDEMIQCIICEDWLHASHLEATVPANEQYSEMICKACMDQNEFLHDYSNFAVNIESGDVDVLPVNGFDTCTAVASNGLLDPEKLTGAMSSSSETSKEIEASNGMDIDTVEPKPEENGDTNKLDIADSNSKLVEEDTPEEKNQEMVQTKDTNRESTIEKESGIDTSLNDQENNFKDDAQETTDLPNVAKKLGKNLEALFMTDIHSTENVKSAEYAAAEKANTNVNSEPIDTEATMNDIMETEVNDCVDKGGKNNEEFDNPEQSVVGVATEPISEKKFVENLVTEVPTDDEKSIANSAEKTEDILQVQKDTTSIAENTNNKLLSEQRKVVIESTQVEETIQNIGGTELPVTEKNQDKLHEKTTKNIKNSELECGSENGSRINVSENYLLEADKVCKDNIDETDKMETTSAKIEQQCFYFKLNESKQETVDAIQESNVVNVTKEFDTENKTNDILADTEVNDSTENTNNQDLLQKIKTTETDSITNKTENSDNETNPLNNTEIESVIANVEINDYVNKIVPTGNDNSLCKDIDENNLYTIANDLEINIDSAHMTEPTNYENKVPSETVISDEINIKENKRKLSVADAEEVSVKKPKCEETKECVRPQGLKKIFKGATFWPASFRHKLCTCNKCISMYQDLAVLYLTDLEDTVFAYETLGKEKINGGPASQYEKGLEALSSLDRVQQINALTEYNKMRDKLLDFLKSFKDRKEIVKEEDIKAFFAGMKPKREPDGVYFCR